MNKIISKKSIGTERLIKPYVSSSVDNLMAFSFMTENSTRSSTRTDMLHEGIKNSFLAMRDVREMQKNKIELFTDNNKSKTSIPDGTGKKIACDITGYSGEVLKFAMLLKGPISSINKNINNYFSNMHGEALRIFTRPANRNIQLIFANFFPNNTFCFDKNYNVIDVEEVKIIKPSDEEYSLLDLGVLSTNFHKANITYDIHPDILKQSNKKDISNKINEIKQDGEPLVSNVNCSELVIAFDNLHISLEKK